MNNKIRRITELVLKAREKRYMRFDIGSKHIQLVIYNEKENEMETSIYCNPGIEGESKLDEMIATLEKLLEKKKLIGKWQDKNIYVGSIVSILTADREIEQIEVDYDYTEFGAVGLRNGDNIGWLSELTILNIK